MADLHKGRDSSLWAEQLVQHKDMSKKELLGNITYFDILEGLMALAIASVCLTFAVANRPGWTWNDKDWLGLGLFLGTTLAFILLRRLVSTQIMPWLRICITALTVAAAVVLFRRWSGMWVGVAVMILLFALCLRSKTVSEGLVREDIYRVLLVVGGIFFALILAEGTLRLIPDLLSEGARARIAWQEGVYQPWHISHPYIGHLHNLERLRLTNARISAQTGAPWTPARFEAWGRFDAWGFRNTEPWPDRVDILAVGDSFTYSLTVNDEQTWPVLLERALAPRHVLNLGLIGAGPQQYLRVYETFGTKLSPKVLLVGLFLGNDLTDALNFDDWWKGGRHKGFMEFMLTKNRTLVGDWLQKSYLYTLSNELRASYRAGQLMWGRTVQLTDGGRVQLVPRHLANQARLSSPDQPAFALVLKTLEHLRDLATQQQTHVLILIFPDKEGVYLPVFGQATADLAAPFLPELDKRGIAYLDFGPHFRKRAAAGETLFWEVDGHPNARGYALIAEVVLAHIQRHAASYGLDRMMPDSARAEIRFEDVSHKAGIAYIGPTVGASWGDFNGDGFPDLFVPNHRLEGNTPNLYLNQRDGTFVDVASTVLSVSPFADLHGAAWADFDNDGDQDLIATSGAGGGGGEEHYPKYLFVNDGGILRNEAKRLGLEDPLGRGRTPLWLDVDNDGRLDVLFMNVPRPDGKAPSVLFRQTANGFENINSQVGFRDAPWSRLEKLRHLLDNIVHLRWRWNSSSLSVGNDRFAQLADLAGNGTLDLIIYSQPSRVYSIGSTSMRDITNRMLFPHQTFVQDVVIEDFDGDGRSDIFLVRSRSGRWRSDFASPKPAVQTDPLKVKGTLGSGRAYGDKTVRLGTEGDITLQLYPTWTDEKERALSSPTVRIGSNLQPAGQLSFTVSPQGAALTGLADVGVDGRNEVSIAFDTASRHWVLRRLGKGMQRIDFVIQSSKPIDQVQIEGFEPSSGELPGVLLLRRGEQFVSQTLSGEVAVPTACHSAVAGDFDNDMDLDLYLVCAGAVENLPNRLYENDGKGNFRLVPDAGGASGSMMGRGDAVVTADYDRDGFLDLFVTNGAGLGPFANGPHQLFRNRGNGNHWLEIDLEGVISNRDGIGASIELEAGGVVQRREQRGGMHGYSQNHQRLHFGLAHNKKVGWIMVRWPSGRVQRVTDVQADQILRIREPADAR